MRKNEEDAVIYPLFSSPVYLRKIKVDLEKIFSLINNDFVKSGDKTTASVSNITKASSDKLVLNKSKWKFLKKIIDNEVNLYTSNILKFKNKIIEHKKIYKRNKQKIKQQMLSHSQDI